MPPDVEIDLAELLTATENASPAAALPTAADHLRRRLDAETVSFQIADAAGEALVDLTSGRTIPVAGTRAGSCWRDQQVVVRDGDPSTVWLPVTVRGDALGVLEVRLPDLGVDRKRVLDQLGAVAHTFGYLLIANQRHTDSYETARRSQHFDLAAEVQHRLLPTAFVCEGGSFTIAGWLEPSATIGGDTFDYVASADRLTASLTDAVGHDVPAALLATLTVNALRNARRNGADLAGQAAAAHEALLTRARDDEYVTGLLFDVDLVREGESAPEGATMHIINAGHPAPLRLRGDAAEWLSLSADAPFGVQPDGRFRVQEYPLQPGDRLLLVTDGMFERSAAGLDLADFLRRTADVHVRNAAQDLARMLRDHVGGDLEDDATLLLFDWHGGTTARSTRSGADTG